MKISNGILIGVLVLAFLAVPVSAATGKTDSGDGQIYTGADQATAPGLAGWTYDSYFFVFNHGVDCTTELPNSGVSSASNAGWGHTTILKSTSSAWVDCPLQTINSITMHHPFVRYGLVQFATQSNKAKITQIDFYSGRNFQKSFALPGWYSTNGETKELTWDLGNWYDSARGINLVFLTRNDNTVSPEWILISGYGARQDYTA